MDLDVDMSTEVFETPDPEVTFQAYAAVSSSNTHNHRVGTSAPEDAHFYDKVRRWNEQTRCFNRAYFLAFVRASLPTAKCYVCAALYRATRS